MKSLRKAIIVGGTGMLADASKEIARQFSHVALVSRTPETLAERIGAKPVPMDWSDTRSIERAMAVLQEQGDYDLLVSWIHDAGLHCLPRFESLLAPTARSIRVHGSAAGDPSAGVKSDIAVKPDIVRQNVVLGWVHESNGRRWLRNDEISAGVVEAFQTPGQQGFVVGTLGLNKL